MSRTENVELTVLCLLHHNGQYLLQDRVKKDWQGFTLPGGHVEPNESIVDAVVREMKEETGLTIIDPKLCGVKHFPIEGGRYIVFLFTATQYHGQLLSSDEGEMHWIKTDELHSVNLVGDFDDLLDVMLNENLSEFQYIIANAALTNKLSCYKIKTTFSVVSDCRQSPRHKLRIFLLKELEITLFWGRSNSFLV